MCTQIAVIYQTCPLILSILTMQGQTSLFKVYDGVAGNFSQEVSKGLLPLLWLLSKPKPHENPQININEYFRVFSASFMKIKS